MCDPVTLSYHSTVARWLERKRCSYLRASACSGRKLQVWKGALLCVELVFKVHKSSTRKAVRMTIDNSTSPNLLNRAIDFYWWSQSISGEILKMILADFLSFWSTLMVSEWHGPNNSKFSASTWCLPKYGPNETNGNCIFGVRHFQIVARKDGFLWTHRCQR